MLTSVRTLMTGLIDYAGLFPPAGLGMAEAVASYAEHRSGPEAWALGRFIVPASRLDELESAAQPHFPRSGEAPWRLSVLTGPGLAGELDRIADFNRRHASTRALIDTVELPAPTADKVTWAASLIAGALVPYYEVSLGGDPRPLIAAIRSSGGRAKVRTGGVTADAFPPAARLARFMAACVEAGVPFKATAGLHHPVRAQYRLGYEPGSPCATMFGFLNVWLAAALLRAGAAATDAVAALEETIPDAFRFDDDGLTWRGQRLDNTLLAAVRERVAIAFGSCSFSEPVDEMKSMGLM